MMVDAEKSQLRAHARARRQELAADHGAPERAAQRFLTMLPETGVRSIAGYWPIGDELDVRPLLHHLALAGHRLALPVVKGKTSPLAFRAWAPGDPMIPGDYGIHTPAATAAEIDPDIIIAPLLAFDADGHRLGYGGGYYDRTLAALRAKCDILAIGYAYAGQKVGRLPRHDGDMVLDAVVTDHAVHWFNKKGFK
jgi:5-formyltetrahydrofolate cyclo-ligase